MAEITPKSAGAQRSAGMTSLQAKLTAIILTIFIVSLGALGGLNYWQANKMLTESINNNLMAIANNKAEHIGDWLQARLGEITMLAAAPVVLGGKQEDIMPFLVSSAKANKVYDTIGYIYRTGRT
jgi:methyl-accepting chemotaxis protein